MASQEPSQEAERFPVEDIVQHPLPGYAAPSSLAFSPDDKLVSFLFSPEGTLNRKLFAFDPQSRQQQLLAAPPGAAVDESQLSTAEKLRRERMRERGLGVTRYEWAKGGPAQRLMLPLPSGVYVQDGPGAELCQWVGCTPEQPIQDPQLSPDGSLIAYVQDDELYVVSADAGPPRQLTTGARGQKKTHGLAEYIAQEEMERRSGFWWSPDSTSIAFTQVDTSQVPPYRIVHQGKEVVGPKAEEEYSYPFAGHANVRVKLGVVAVSGGADVVWMDVEAGRSDVGHDEEYLARVTWMPEGALVAQVQNRAQTRLQVLRFNRATGQRQLLFVEENPVWINLHDCFTPLHKGTGALAGGFLWASERSGFRHLYLYNKAGEPLGAVTEGKWMVEQVSGVDEAAGLVYFTGTADSPLETHLYVTPLSPLATSKLGGPTAGADGDRPQWPRRVTQGAGRHVVSLDHGLQRFVDVYDSLGSAPRVLLCSLLDGKVLMSIYEQPAADPRMARLPLKAPELVELKVADGTPDGVSLWGALFRPDPAVHGPPPYRTVVSVYGGPHVQTVSNSWMSFVDMRAQYLCSKGFVVWKLDNRGSSRRGLAFEAAIKHHAGTVDLEDQATGVRWLIESGLADPANIGIYGWSYGGYMAVLALARFPDLFKCAVAGAPVTSWDGYDTHYTERYMGQPEENKHGYKQSAVMTHVAGIKGPLMLVHGMVDENVHFRHTCRLVSELNTESKTYELLVFPDERHMPRSVKDRKYMEERISAFLDRGLR